MERHDLINTFKPEAYWKICPEVEVKGAPMTLKYQRGKIFDRKVAQALLDFLSEDPTALVGARFPSRISSSSSGEGIVFCCLFFFLGGETRSWS